MGFLSSVAGGLAKGFLGGVASSLGGSLGNLVTGGVASAMDYKTSVKLMEKQFDLQKDLNKYNAVNRYPWAVQSLRDANLNPILAATQGQPLAGGSPQYNDVSIATRAISSARALQEMEAIQANISRTKADTQKSKAETLAALNLAGQYSASAAQMKANTAQINMLLDYYRKHPEVFAGQQLDRMGSKSGWIGLISEYLSNSANSRLNRRIKRFDYGADK